MDNGNWLSPQLEGMSSQAMRAQARRLAAYLPMTVTRQILQGELPPPGTAVREDAATLFSDLSGFTRMAEELAAVGPRGAEELNRALLMTFTGLINAIHDAGGEVVHFHGDAMLVYFPDEDGRAAPRALACASFMQRLMRSTLALETSPLPAETAHPFHLNIKIGVGYGRCLQTIVGQVGQSLEFVLGGTAVDEAVIAQQQALAGQVVASQATLLRAGLASATPFRLVEETSPAPYAREELHWDVYDAAALRRFLTIVPAFLPPALYDRLQHQTTRFVAEHRAVTSLFVQFDGIDLNAADAAEKLQAYYEWAWQVVARFGPRNGRVNRLLTGDKGSQLHILFGAPVAPDAPEQAIRCALALQREKPAFIAEQRIGLAAGPVFATAVGSQNRREYTAIGRVVNLSAHLAVRCPNGGLLVDEATAGRVWPQFQFESLPPTTLKGHADPVAIYRAVGEQLPPTQFAARFARWRQPSPGREEERAQLRQRLAAALRGKGGLMALSGHFGGGIRSLLAEAARTWLEAGGRGLSGVCQPHLADAPFSPWQAIWRDLFGLSPEMPLQEQASRVAAEIRALLPTWADEVPLWLAAMGLPMPGRGTTEAEVVAVGVRQLWLFTLVQRCLAQAARSQPLLILLEDVQWADEASLKLVAELATAVTELPLLLVVTFRPGATFHFPVLNAATTTHIVLADWSAPQAQAVVQRKLGTADLPPLLAQRLGLRDEHGREASQVNPLFLEESLKMILSSEVLQFDPSGRLRVDETRLAALPIPDTIATLLQTRLDALSAGASSLLQVAAVIGREFELDALTEIAPGLNKTAALSLLHELVEAELVQTMAGGLEPVFTFQDSLLQEVVYRSLPYARRQSLHLAMAEWVARQPQYQTAFALLAHHYGQAEEHKAGLYYALAAANDAATLYAHRTAVALYQQALAHFQAMVAAGQAGIAGQADTAVNILIAQGQCHFLLGELEAAARAVAQALEFCQVAADETLWCTAVNLLAEIGLAQARYPEAATLVGQVFGNQEIETEEGIPEALLARAYYLAGLAAIGQFQWSLAEAHLGQARAILKEHRLVRPEAASGSPLPELLVALGLVRSQQGTQQKRQQAVELCQQALDVAQQYELTIPAIQAMLALAQVRLAQGRAAEAVQTAMEAAELAGAAAPRLLAHLLLLRAEGLAYDGRFPETLADLEQAQALFAAMDDGLGQLRLYLAWGNYCAGLDDWAGMLPWLDKAREQLAALLKTGGTAVTEAVQLRLGLAQVALHTKQWPQAASLLAVALAEVAAPHLAWLRPALLCAQGRAHEAMGKRAAAEKAYRAAFIAVNQGGNPDELPLILLQLAQLTPTDDARHWEYLEGCVTAVYDRARHSDKITCLQAAGTLLLQAPDLRLRRIGSGCLAAVPR